MSDYFWNSKSEYNQPWLGIWKEKLKVEGVEKGLP